MNHRHLPEAGQGIVEFAVIFPLFVIVLFLLIDGGMLMGRYNNINNAAKEGARLAAVGANADAVATRVAQQAHGDLDGATGCGPGANTICLQWAGGPDGESAGQVGSTVKVTVHYRYGLKTPLLGGKILGYSVLGFDGGFDVSACAVQRLERPVADPSPVVDSASCD